MFYTSDILTKSPESFSTPLQKEVYAALSKLNIPFERIDTDEAITMEDCKTIDKKLNMHTVKTLFLCNRQKTSFYLFITRGDKSFSSKNFSAALNISRVSFAPPEVMLEMLGTKVGAATIFGVLQDADNEIQVVIDKDVTESEYYGCSDGTTTCYMKLRTDDVFGKFLSFTGHRAIITEV